MKTSIEDLGREEDGAGILRTRDYFHTLIRDEKTHKGIPSERIVLGGFSQGGAISILSGLSCPTKLGGIFALSGYLPTRDKVKEMVPSDNPNKDTKIFMGHGVDDPLVKFDWGAKTAETLKEWGYSVEFHGYPYALL
jgi:predicted esterase